MTYRYNRDDWKVLKTLEQSERNTVKELNAHIKKPRAKVKRLKCPNCGKFVKADNNHGVHCYLLHCKKCGRFMNEKGIHACRSKKQHESPFLPADMLMLHAAASPRV